MAKYLEPTLELDEEYRSKNKYKGVEKDIESTRYKSGPERGRYQRDRKGRLVIVFPWLWAGMFSK